jgi:hypothetical protein
MRSHPYGEIEKGSEAADFVRAAEGPQYKSLFGFKKTKPGKDL